MNYRLYIAAALPIAIGLVGAAAKLNAQDAKKDVKADPAAVEALREAHDKRETFPPGFAGLSANVTVSDSAGKTTGKMDYTSTGEVKLVLDNASKDLQEWAKDQLDSAFTHRRADDWAHGDGSYPITFDGDDHSPLGRQVALNDKGNSHYRVRDGHISQVNRAMGPTMKFSITVMADKNLPDGKYLPSQFTVTYFDASGAIKRFDMFTDGFKKVSDVWVPSSRRVIIAEKGAFTARSFALDDIKLAGATTATAAK